MSLKTDMVKLLNDSISLCKSSNSKEARELEKSIIQMQERINQPLRVAVVGIMKAGKSTFLNALIGTDLLYTGELETTYTVCWFKYCNEPAIKVHLKNSDDIITDSIVNLDKWSVRNSKNINPLLDEVEYIEILYPSEILKTIEFIDTPGLNSIHRTDSKNTVSFLSLDPNDTAESITLEEAGKADAIIYAFSRAISSTDYEAINAFYKGKGGETSPINSIGILTKVDGTGIWDILDASSPVETADRLTKSMMSREEVLKKIFYTILPVCTKPCEGMLKLSDADWKTLESCALLDESLLTMYLYDAASFSNENNEIYNCIGTVEQRSRLISILGQYGILQVSRLLKEGYTRENIRRKMFELCGLNRVKEITEQHFGHRAFLIQSQFVLNYLRRVTIQIINANTADYQLNSICRQISNKIDTIMSSTQTMRELDVLKLYYSNLLKFDNEETKNDFLRITGEQGRTVEARLGVEGSKSVGELAEVALEKANKWNAIANDIIFTQKTVRDVAKVVTRSYEDIYYHLSSVCE